MTSQNQSQTSSNNINQLANRPNHTVMDQSESEAAQQSDAFRLFELLPTDPTSGIMDYFDHKSFIHFGRTSKSMKETVLNPKFWSSPVITGGGLLTIQQFPKNVIDADPTIRPHATDRLVMDVGQRLADSLLRYCRTKVEWFSSPSLSYGLASAKRTPTVGAVVLPRNEFVHQPPFVSAPELVSLASIPNLRILDALGHTGDLFRIGRTKIKPPKWNWLLERSNLLKHLEILRLGSSLDCQIDKHSIELISRLPRLHTFIFECAMYMSPVGLFESLHQSTSLRTLQFPTDFFDAKRLHLMEVKKCTNLTTLSLRCFELQSQEFVDFFTHPNIAGSLEYLAFKFSDRDPRMGIREKFDPSVIFQSAFTRLTSLRCLLLSIERRRATDINQLLPHLVHLSHLSQLIITFNVDMPPPQYPCTYLPSIPNLQLLSEQPNMERICLENIDIPGYPGSNNLTRLVTLPREYIDTITKMPKVEWNSEGRRVWTLPKQLQQLKQD